MADLVHIEQFISLSGSFPVVDVRSPSEYERGHIPGARNIPLFDDHERKVVGTTYKQVNRESAMYAGLEFAGRKLAKLAREGEKAAGRQKTLLVHCWRGGMRSKSMVWLFETMGIKCYLLEGGYKSYRRLVREEFAKPLLLYVLGGRTGSGKTTLLHRMKELGEQVIDLEALAHHKGSAFGALGEQPQPTTEHFENQLCQELGSLDRKKHTWVEDESRNVGRCVIPGEFYNQMRSGRMVFLDIPREKRALHLVKDYAQYPPDELKDCVRKIERKLGGEKMKQALESIEQKDFYQTALLTLQYYDKAYMHSLEINHEEYSVLNAEGVDPETNAEILLAHVRS